MKRMRRLQAIAFLSAGLLGTLVHGALFAAEMSLPVQALPTWTGVVTHVVDGDTVHVRPVAGGAPRSLRLLGMDAPEICQEGGVAARDALNERVFQRQVQVQVQGTDDYGRDLVRLYLASEDVGQWMVQRGQAWSYRFRQDAGPYAEQSGMPRFCDAAFLPACHPKTPGTSGVATARARVSAANFCSLQYVVSGRLTLCHRLCSRVRAGCLFRSSACAARPASAAGRPTTRRQRRAT